MIVSSINRALLLLRLYEVLQAKALRRAARFICARTRMASTKRIYLRSTLVAKANTVDRTMYSTTMQDDNARRTDSRQDEAVGCVDLCRHVNPVLLGVPWSRATQLMVQALYCMYPRQRKMSHNRRCSSADNTGSTAQQQVLIFAMQYTKDNTVATSVRYQADSTI